MLDQANYQLLIIEKNDGVATITMNRPERLNAVSPRMHGELARVFRDAQMDADTRAVVITGAGRGFTAGGDFGPGEPGYKRPGGLSVFQEGRLIVDDILDLEKPLIAA